MLFIDAAYNVLSFGLFEECFVTSEVNTLVWFIDALIASCWTYVRTVYLAKIRPEP